MEFWTPYKDISELGKLWNAHLPGEDPHAYIAKSPLEAFPEVEEMISTPIAFVHFANGEGKTYGGHEKMLKAAGWTHVTSVLNWHDGHRGDNEMRLYMKKFPQNPPLSRRRLAEEDEYSGSRKHMYPCHKSFLYGCGGRILNGWTNIFDDGIAWEKFLTLLRIPIDMAISPVRLKWLKALNYRPLPDFSTSAANYWVNGWAPGEWPGKRAERAYWDTYKAPAPTLSSNAALQREIAENEQWVKARREQQEPPQEEVQQVEQEF